jgi:transcriptional regulator with XRE-family HTH domain
MPIIREVDTVGFGRGIRALRMQARLTQEALSGRAGVSRSVVARIEQGRADRTTIATLDRVAAALGARVACRLLWQGEGLDRLLDADHAATVEAVVRALLGDGWLVATEVSFNVWGERGSIDVLAFHPATRTLLVIEVKSVVPDVQATLVTLDRKEPLALDIARERGWDAIAVARLLVIRDDRTARRRIDEHAATFGNAFPDRIARIRAWLKTPDPARPLRGLWFLSPGPQAVTRRRAHRPPEPSERGRRGDS